jgi:hypothetical protein
MHYRIAAVLLFAGLPAMTVLAAPAPEPSAILDIGSPEKGETPEQHSKRAIECLGDRWCALTGAWHDLKGSKLPSIEAKKDPRPWLEKNIRITKADADGRRLRLTFRAGNRAEQVAILNAVFRAYMQSMKEYRRFLENCLRSDEACIDGLLKRIESEQDPRKVQEYRKGIEELRSSRIPEARARIARHQQIAVIRWAK